MAHLRSFRSANYYDYLYRLIHNVKVGQPLSNRSCHSEDKTIMKAETVIFDTVGNVNYDAPIFRNGSVCSVVNCGLIFEI